MGRKKKKPTIIGQAIIDLIVGIILILIDKLLG